jgi:hypothetical protein
MTSSIPPTPSLLVLGLLLIGSGCTWGLGDPSSETSAMHERFSLTLEIQTGLVIGDMDRVAEIAQWLAEPPEEAEFGGEAQSFLDQISTEASRMLQATEPDAAAEMMGRLGLACGGCHQASGGGPNFVLGSNPPEGNSTGRTMIRHIWAMDRLWEGLIGPSQESWQAGLQALNQSGDTFEKLAQSSTQPERVGGYVSTLQDLGAGVRNTETLEARASVFGELLRSCQGCHAVMGVGR